MGGICVPVHVRALSDAEVLSSASIVGWIDKVKASVQVVVEQYQDLWREADGSAPRPVTTGLSQRTRSSCLGAGVPHCQVLRRRKMTARTSQQTVSNGFHLLSDPILVESALDELTAAMTALKDLCSEFGREWTNAMSPTTRTTGVRILLILDECDHLIQQRHFQDAIAEVLRRCASYSIVLSTQQPMVETGGGWFKVVHQQVAKPLRLHAGYAQRLRESLEW